MVRTGFTLGAAPGRLQGSPPLTIQLFIKSKKFAYLFELSGKYLFILVHTENTSKILEGNFFLCLVWQKKNDFLR